MQALILAAGYGTRLKEIAENTPKPLMPVNGRPLIDYILDRLRGLKGLQRIHVVTNNKFYQDFTEWAKKADVGVEINVINDGTNSPDDRLGSIGDINFVLEEAKVADDLLVVGGDNLFDFNVDEYLSFAAAKDSAVSIGVYDIGDLKQAGNFGVVAVDAEKKVVSFEEKPEEPKSTLIAMCFYYFPQKTLSLIGDYLRATKKADRAGDYIRWLLEKCEVFGFEFSGKWYDIGTVEAYHEAQKKFIISSNTERTK